MPLGPPVPPTSQPSPLPGTSSPPPPLGPPIGLPPPPGPPLAPPPPGVTPPPPPLGAPAPLPALPSSPTPSPPISPPPGSPPPPPGPGARLNDPGAPSAAVAEITFTAGTGSYQLNKTSPNALSAYFPFSEVFVDGATITYEVDDTARKEIVIGTFNRAANTLSRDTVLFSSNGNALVNWSITGQRIVRPLTTGIPLCATQPTLGQVLIWDGKEWCPATLPPAPHFPICPTPPLNGQILVFDAVTGEYCPADFCTLVAACVSPPPPPPAPPGPPPIVDTWVTLSTTVSPTIPTRTITLTTRFPDEIILLHVGISAEAGPAPHVVSVTSSSGLAWRKRSGASGITAIGVGANFAGASLYGDAEVWWAISHNVLLNEVITVNVSSQLAFMILETGGVRGVDLATPWDTNSSLPAYSINLIGDGIATTQVTGISTDAVDGLALLFYDDYKNTHFIGATGPITLTRLAEDGAIQAFIPLAINSDVFDGTATSTLSNATFVAHRLSGADGPLNGWIMIADALRAALTG